MVKFFDLIAAANPAYEVFDFVKNSHSYACKVKIIIDRAGTTFFLWFNSFQN